MADEPNALTPADDFPLETPEGPFGDFSRLDERMGRALQAFAKSLDVEKSCEAAGVAYNTWYTWRHRYPEFVQAEEQIRNQKADQVEDAHVRAALEGNVEAQKSILKAYKPRYRDRQTIEVVSPDVQQRLQRQADAIVHLCQMELPEPYKSTFAAKIAETLREIWS